jgi:hypothetical protein
MGAYSYALGSPLRPHSDSSHSIGDPSNRANLSEQGARGQFVPCPSTAYLAKSLPESILRFSPVVTGVLQILRTRV